MIRIDLEKQKKVKFKVNAINNSNTSLNLELDGNVNIFFGKNGSGKTTLAQLIKEQYGENNDVRIYDGFDHILSTNNELDLVVIGEKNNLIDKKINKINELLVQHKFKFDEINSDIEITEQTKENALIHRYNAIKEKIDKANKSRDDILRNIASNIKNVKDPSISSANYDIAYLKKEYDDAIKNNIISDSEINGLNDTILTKERIARDVFIGIIDDDETILEEVNRALTTSLPEPVYIERFDGENADNKKQFAKIGLDLHKNLNKCVFCGNEIAEETKKELYIYFNSKNIVEFQTLLNQLEEKIVTKIKTIENINIEIEDFYPEYSSKINELKIELNNIIKSQIKYYNVLKDAVENKNKNIAKKFDLISNIERPVSFLALKSKYEKIKTENNNRELSLLKEEAKKKMRYYIINNERKKKNLSAIETDIETEKKMLNGYEKEINDKRDMLNNIDAQINCMKKFVHILEQSTENVNILKDKINDSLKGYVSFELDVYGTKNNGYYNVVDKNSREKRSVKDLSTGEKNIIGFLYFVEKLDEIKNNSKPVIVIFDDPMNSNDDTMQYIILEKLIELAKNSNLSKYNIQHLIMLTHNTYFFLNITDSNFGIKGLKKEAKYLLYKNNDFSVIDNNNLSCIKCAYAMLWDEIKILRDDTKTSSDVLCNPMRRIIETYVKFNNINKDDFYKKVLGSKKYLNVNSHDDDPTYQFYSDTSALTKEELINIFKQLFIQNNAKNHYDAYMQNDDIKL